MSNTRSSTEASFLLHRTYSPYGYHTLVPGISTQLAFNSEHILTRINCYLLGNGKRAYSPVLMRFLNPDPLSPFHRGGLNAYAYCACDPVNRTDPSGYSWWRPQRPRPLTDVKQGKLSSEVELMKGYMDDNKAQINMPTHVNFFKNDIRPEQKHKWVMTEDNKFIIGSYDDASGTDPSHSSIVAIAAKSEISHPTAISAGMLTIKDGVIQLNNESGHYLTPFDTLAYVKNHLKKLEGWKASGLKIRRVRFEHD
ncbi:RHS repeat-associated core domain-containing protein [Pseudomonas sp. KCJK9058]|uniref:RHS repeat-associated core domain-containing protein n=1 Tax=unclassified Pseudomonas TaxID=196821 RepID=UPI0039060D6B